MARPLQRAIAIPEPTNDVDSLWRTTQALKEAVEVIQGIRGNRAAALQCDLDELQSDTESVTNNIISSGSTTLASLTDTDVVGQSQNDLFYNADGATWSDTDGKLTWDGSGLSIKDASGNKGGRHSHDGSNYNLDLTGTIGWDITGAEWFRVSNYTFDVGQVFGAGQDGYVLTYDDATGAISLEESAGAGATFSSLSDTDDSSAAIYDMLYRFGNKWTDTDGFLQWDSTTSTIITRFDTTSNGRKEWHIHTEDSLNGTLLIQANDPWTTEYGVSIDAGGYLSIYSDLSDDIAGPLPAYGDTFYSALTWETNDGTNSLGEMGYYGDHLLQIGSFVEGGDLGLYIYDTTPGVDDFKFVFQLDVSEQSAWLQEGWKLRIGSSDSGDWFGAGTDITNPAEYTEFWQSGIDFNTTFVSTTDWNITGLTGVMNVVSTLRISDTGDTDWLAMQHDGTDFNFDFTNTTDWNISGATQYNFDNLVKVGALNVNIEDNLESLLTVGEPTTLRGADQDGAIEIYSEHLSTIHGVRMEVVQNRLDVIAPSSGTKVLSMNYDIGTISYLTGATVQFLDSTNTDATSMKQFIDRFAITVEPGDRVDVNTDVGLGVVGGGYLWARDGGGLRVSDAGDTDWGEFNHDGTDFSTVFTNTGDWDISGLTGRLTADSGAETYAYISELPTGGASIVGQYRFDTSTTEADPGNGDFRMNHVSPAFVTEVFVSTTTDNGNDFDNMLGILADGDQIYIQQDNDATRYILLDVTATVDNTGWYSIAGTMSSSGSLFASNAKCHILILFGGTGGGGVTKVGTTVQNEAAFWDGDGVLKSLDRFSWNGVDGINSAFTLEGALGIASGTATGSSLSFNETNLFSATVINVLINSGSLSDSVGMSVSNISGTGSHWGYYANSGANVDAIAFIADNNATNTSPMVRLNNDGSGASIDINNTGTGEAIDVTGGQVTLAAGVAAYPSLNIPEGVAPSAPVDGDVWITAAGAFNARLNGSTVDLAAGGGDVTKVGTPVNNEIGVWTGDGTIEGTSNFQWDNSGTTNDALQITAPSGLTSGYVVDLVSNQSGKTGDMVRMIQNHASSSADILFMQQNGSGGWFNLTAPFANTQPSLGEMSTNGICSGSILSLWHKNASTTGECLEIRNSGTGLAIKVWLGETVLAPSVAAYPSLNIPEGVAPTALTDGDVWVTAAGAFNARLNGATVDLSTDTDTQATVTSTTTLLADITDAINTDASKVAGFMVFNTTTSQPVWAVGNADGSVWVDATGATAHTPV